MQTKTRQELYQWFIEFVGIDFQNERRLSNRRMLSVFVWCFFLPVLCSLVTLLLVKVGVLPVRLKGNLDWLILILPVFYSLYILGSEVLVQIPSAVRRGAFVTTLASSVRESAWRDRVIEDMHKELLNHQKKPNSSDWHWIVTSFQMDLEAMQQRTRYLTALAGAVFFLLMQGIDSIAEPDEKLELMRTNFLGWIGTSANDFSQFVGLVLFLLLLYLSGSQTTQALRRYLNCAQLLSQEFEKQNPR